MIDWNDYESGAVAVMCSNDDECDKFKSLCKADGVKCAVAWCGPGKYAKISYHMDYVSLGGSTGWCYAGYYASLIPGHPNYAIELPLIDFISQYTCSCLDFDDDSFIGLLGVTSYD